MHLINRTPFLASAFIDLDRTGAQVLVLAIKATFDLVASNKPSLSAVQRPFAFADVFAGEAGSSSLLYESDANWGRAGTDVAFVGYAHPAREGDCEANVALRVGPLLKAAHVFGDRMWITRMGRSRLTSPRPFVRMPLIYERAFGGIDNSSPQPDEAEAEARNPVGMGFKARKSRKSHGEIVPPNIEDPQRLIRNIDDRPAPVGFSYVAKAWQPRLGYAGTYDDAWQANRMPLLPIDFDPCFYRASSEGLCATPWLSGGEQIELLGLTPRQHDQSSVPTVRLSCAFGIDAQITAIPMNLDSLVIDAAHSKLVLAWHGARPVEGLVDDIEWVLAEADLH